ncbi:hypothetical protein H6G51_04285 [Limnothrix sp. FACHB-708]|nr:MULTISPECIES: hypothetical protein [unclassified Limnothrix]MBD2190846.1 hypothetical protein [Limnothrix sp. FACHB-1088]MBD2552492.1 hypothetical protein [Limnothrix sp. FACHB-708]
MRTKSAVLLDRRSPPACFAQCQCGGARSSNRKPFAPIEPLGVSHRG